MRSGDGVGGGGGGVVCGEQLTVDEQADTTAAFMTSSVYNVKVGAYFCRC